jgi:hypothetical protein
MLSAAEEAEESEEEELLWSSSSGIEFGGGIGTGRGLLGGFCGSVVPFMVWRNRSDMMGGLRMLELLASAALDWTMNY